MKKLFFTLLFGLILFSIQSQNSWEYYNLDNDIREEVVHSYEFEQGKILTISFVFDTIQNNVDKYNLESNLRVHDFNSGIILENSVYSIDSLSARLFWIFYNKVEENFIIAGEAHSIGVNNKRGYFLLTKWDKNLKMISDTIIRLEPFENNEIWYLAGNMSKDEEFLLIGYCSHIINNLPFNTKTIVARIGKSGDIDKISWLKTKTDNSSIFYESEIDRYILFSSRIFYLNRDLEIVDSLFSFDAVEYDNGYFGQATKFDSNKYLISVQYHSGKERGLAFFDSGFNYKKGIKIERSAPFDVSIFKPNFDFIDTSEIYFGTFDAHFNYFSIAKVNSNLEPYWIKYYSVDDTFKHVVWSIAASSDGGCIITGGKSENIEYNILDDMSAWVLKLDGNGDLVSTDDPTIERWEITVYPNPSSGDFIIEIGEMIEAPELFLYDFNGQELWQNADLHKGENKFFFHGLPTGTYVWRLAVDGKPIGGGMWVKK